MNREEMTAFLWFIAVILIAGIIITLKMDKDWDKEMEKECRSCDSKAVFCIDYFKEQGKCGY